MTTRTLMDTHADGLEEDEAQKVAVSVEMCSFGLSTPSVPVVDINGPDGEIELVGRQQIEAAIAALQKALLS